MGDKDPYRQGFEDGKDNFMGDSSDFLDKRYREGWTRGRDERMFRIKGSGGSYTEKKGCSLWT